MNSKSNYKKNKTKKSMYPTSLAFKKRRGRDSNIAKWHRSKKQIQDAATSHNPETKNLLVPPMTEPIENNSFANDVQMDLALCETPSSSTNNEEPLIVYGNQVQLSHQSEPLAAHVESRKCDVLTGHRIVDMNFFLTQFLQIVNHESLFNCGGKHLKVVREFRSGLISRITFQCELCKFLGHAYTSDKNNSLNLNLAAVEGTLNIGVGQTHFRDLCDSMSIPPMKATTFRKYQSRIEDILEECAFEEMKLAAEEEKKIALEEGNVGPDGIPEIMVVCDGTWAKRSYRTNYNSTSGAAAIIGYKTKKVLFLGVKNKYCLICKIAENKGIEAKEHKCFKNWNGSSTGMESAILVEGFCSSEQMYGLRYTKFIGDGDSNCFKKILESRPYYKTVEKIECRNHLLRNFCTKVKEITSKSSLGSAQLRREIAGKILKMRISVMKAVRHRNMENTSSSDKCLLLKGDIMNISSHTFGEHKKCASIGYFCLKTVPDNDNKVPSMTRSGIFYRLQESFCRLANHSRSLLCDVDSNLVEQFNNLICKFIGGKRVNYTSRGQYRARCYAAVMRQNTKKTLHHLIHRKKYNFSPKVKYYNRICKQNLKKCRKTLFNKVPQEDLVQYGEKCEKPDMTEADFELARKEFLNSLIKTEDEIEQLQIRTIYQADSTEWKEERRKIITSSNFGTICNRRKDTSCSNLVKQLLYSTEIKSAAIEWGKNNEATAKKSLELINNISIQDCGLFVDTEFFFLGATPDGLIKESGIVEIKCPYSTRAMTPEEAILQRKIQFWKKDFTVNENHKWYYQVQGQLHITRRDYCLFCVWTPKGMKTQIIMKNDEFWQEKMLPKLEKFYMDCVLPELVDPRVPRGLKIRDPKYITDAMKDKK